MAARSYQRPSFSAVRDEERRRVAEILAMRPELERVHGDDVDRVLNGAISDGSSAAALREQAARLGIARRHDEIATDIRLVPPLGEVESTAVVLRLMGRDDLAREALSAASAGRPEYSGAEAPDGHPRDLLLQVVGVAGAGVNLEPVLWDALEAAGSGVRLASTAGARGAAALGRAIRTAAALVVGDAWRRSGRYWRTACRVVEVPNFKPTRVWFSRGGYRGREAVESAPPSLLASDGAASWPYADLSVRSDAYQGALLLTKRRIYNTGDMGMAEVSSFVDSTLAGWVDKLDGETAAALESAPVQAGGFTAANVSVAIAALAKQEIGGRPLGADRRPHALVGTDREALARSMAPRAADDEGAVLGGVAVSSAAGVGKGSFYLVSPSFRPAAIGMLSGVERELEPRMLYGPVAAVPIDPAGRVYGQGGVRLTMDASLPTPVREGPAGGGGLVVGAIRLTA